MKVRFNCIVAYLSEKQKSKFTGSIKLSFEGGDVVAVNEANKHDLPLTKNDESNVIDKYLNMASDPLFNGAVVFVFESGEVTEYSYSKSYKGETLKRFLGV